MKNIDDILQQNKAKGEPFKVPDGYFEDFEARLNARIDALDTAKNGDDKKDNKRGIWLTLKPLLYVAACITALYAATYVIVQPKIRTSAIQEAKLTEQDSIKKMNQEYEDFYQYFVEDFDDDDDSMIDLLTSNN